MNLSIPNRMPVSKLVQNQDGTFGQESKPLLLPEALGVNQRATAILPATR